jgi:hypothetical protein
VVVEGGLGLGHAKNDMGAFVRGKAALYQSQKLHLQLFLPEASWKLQRMDLESLRKPGPLVPEAVGKLWLEARRV